MSWQWQFASSSNLKGNLLLRTTAYC